MVEADIVTMEEMTDLMEQTDQLLRITVPSIKDEAKNDEKETLTQGSVESESSYSDLRPPI